MSSVTGVQLDGQVRLYGLLKRRRMPLEDMLTTLPSSRTGAMRNLTATHTSAGCWPLLHKWYFWHGCRYKRVRGCAPATYRSTAEEMGRRVAPRLHGLRCRYAITSLVQYLGPASYRDNIDVQFHWISLTTVQGLIRLRTARSDVRTPAGENGHLKRKKVQISSGAHPLSDSVTRSVTGDKADGARSWPLTYI